MSKKPSLRALALQRPGPVLICRKCLKRMVDGGKLRRRLKASLEERSGGQKKMRSRLILTNCFGICPRYAVVTASSATFARGELILIQDCSGESIEKATEALLDPRIVGSYGYPSPGTMSDGATSLVAVALGHQVFGEIAERRPWQRGERKRPGDVDRSQPEPRREQAVEYPFAKPLREFCRDAVA